VAVNNRMIVIELRSDAARWLGCLSAAHRSGALRVAPYTHICRIIPSARLLAASHGNVAAFRALPRAAPWISHSLARASFYLAPRTTCAALLRVVIVHQRAATLLPFSSAGHEQRAYVCG